MENQIQMTSEAIKKKLIERAKLLAQAIEPEILSTGDHLELTEFMLADERYALESIFIHEVYPVKEIVPVPCTPAFVTGIVNVRGKIITVIDIKLFFEIPANQAKGTRKIIIVNRGDTEMGLLVDEIVGVKIIPRHQIQEPIPTLTGIRDQYLKGLTKEGLVILDILKLFADEKLVVNEEVAE